MLAMLLESPGKALQRAELPLPEYGDNEILLKVRACGVCRTDLHILDGELSAPKLPLILGHEIVGTVIAKGRQVERFAINQRVGCPGSAIRADIAATALAGVRIFAMTPILPDIR